MRAVTFETTGNPAEVLRVVDRPSPEPAEGQVVVRMRAAAINPSDLMFVRGVYGVKPQSPATPGFEGCGVVTSHRAGLYGHGLLGRRVTVAASAGGTWAEEVAVDARNVLPVPSALDDAAAAMAFVNPFTAFVMTRRVLRPAHGDWLLQTAANSALGRMVIKLGRREGFRTLNVVRRESEVAELERLGADRVVVFDADREPASAFRERIAAAEVGPLRAAIDPVGGRLGTAVLGRLEEGGRLLVYGSLAGGPVEADPRRLLTYGVSVEPFWLKRWMERRSVTGKLADLLAVRRRLTDGTLALPVGESFPLEGIADAVAATTRPGRGGKPWLRFD